MLDHLRIIFDFIVSNKPCSCGNIPIVYKQLDEKKSFTFSKEGDNPIFTKLSEFSSQWEVLLTNNGKKFPLATLIESQGPKPDSITGIGSDQILVFSFSSIFLIFNLFGILSIESTSTFLCSENNYFLLSFLKYLST